MIHSAGVPIQRIKGCKNPFYCIIKVGVLQHYPAVRRKKSAIRRVGELRIVCGFDYGYKPRATSRA